MSFGEYVNTARQYENATIQQVLGAQQMPMQMQMPMPMQSSVQMPMMQTQIITPAAPMIINQPVPGYVLQPNFGMIPVPPEAMASNCGVSLTDDATMALLTLTFRPKKLSEDEHELMEKLIRNGMKRTKT
jgi:hypothetical protein